MRNSLASRPLAHNSPSIPVELPMVDLVGLPMRSPSHLWREHVRPRIARFVPQLMEEIMARNNFGLETRDLAKAGRFALRRACMSKQVSFATAATDASRWQRFAAYAIDHGVRWMENISADLVRAYGSELACLVQDDEMEAAYAQNLISAVNTVMNLATRGRWLSVSPTQCGVPERQHVRHRIPDGYDKAVTADGIQALCDAGMSRAAGVAQLAREFNVRLKEGAMLDCKAALREARKSREITVVRGTKGGKKRIIPVLKSTQTAALEAVAAIQGTDACLIPRDQNWSQFRDGEIRAARPLLKVSGISNFRELRTANACERYRDRTGCDAPVFQTARADPSVDRDARLQGAKELGHGRIEITNCYIGGRRK